MNMVEADFERDGSGLRSAPPAIVLQPAAFPVGRRLGSGTDFQQFCHSFVTEGPAQARQQIYKFKGRG